MSTPVRATTICSVRSAHLPFTARLLAQARNSWRVLGSLSPVRASLRETLTADVADAYRRYKLPTPLPNISSVQLAIGKPCDHPAAIA